MTEPRKGLLLWVSRAAIGDCSNGGFSGRTDRCVLLGTVTYDATGSGFEVEPVDKYSQVFEPNVDRPAVWLVLNRHAKGNVFIQPGHPITGEFEPGPWFMNGGNFADTSDSRFNDLLQDKIGVRGVAIRIHDRQERG